MDVVKDVDYILDHFVGGGHWWQWKITLLMYPTAWAAGYPLFLHIFGAYEPSHRCYVPTCDTASSIINETHMDFSIPRELTSKNIFTESEKFDSCNRYNFSDNFVDQISQFSAPIPALINKLTCSEDHFDQNSTMPCESFIYNRDVFTNTITMDLNLVCEDGEYKQRLLGTLMMLGLLVGSFVGGRLGDRFGRKPVMFGALSILVPAVAAGGVYPNYLAYAILRFISAAMLPVMWVSMTAYGLEIFSPGTRKLVTAIKEFPIGMFILCLILYYVRDWQHLHYWTAAACALGLPAYFFIPESPRWLIMHGRKDEAMKIFQEIADTNGKKLSPSDLKAMADIVDSIENESKSDNNLTPLDMFRRDTFFKTLIMFFCWIMACLGYYALTLNSTNLAGDPILNFCLAYVCDIPLSLFLFVTLDRLGRRWTTVITHVTTGVACVVLAFIPKSQTAALLAVYLLGKAAASAGFQMVWLYTNELYPTNLRAQAIGTSSSISRVFGLCAPFIGSLAKYWQPLPMLVLGVPTVLSGILAAFLPETANKILPQTMSQASSLGKALPAGAESNNKSGPHRESINLENIY